jgi:hypothetical protein
LNANFIRQHALCGKSRMRRTKKFPTAVWFGAPKSEQFTRCYPKMSIRRFRVELQFNRGAIEKYGLDDLKAWTSLPHIMSRHIGFYRVKWIQLTAHIVRHFRYANDILREAHYREKNLFELMRFLRQIKVSNPTRFLVPMPENGEIAKALKQWRRRWMRDGRPQ